MWLGLRRCVNLRVDGVRELELFEQRGLSLQKSERPATSRSERNVIVYGKGEVM